MQFGTFFPPMLLSEEEQPFDSDKFLYELKFDGIRATIHVSPITFKIFNRRGFEITHLYPELKNIQKLIKEQRIFDGELVLFVNNKPNFSKLQERSHLKNKEKIKHFAHTYPVCFIAFDCVYKKKDITNKTLLERKQILAQVPDNDYFIKTVYSLKEGKKLFKKVQENELEGIVAKRIDSVYQINTRSDNWIKIKNMKLESFYIGGYLDDEKNPMVKLYLGEFHNNKLYFVGKVMVGKKAEIYQQILEAKHVKKTPFCDYQEDLVNYIKPILNCKVAYIERTKSNHLRQPIFKE